MGVGLAWAWAERQNRLLSALLQDEESLDQLVTGITRCAPVPVVDSRQVAGDQVDK
jgi:hypothetical protein